MLVVTEKFPLKVPKVTSRTKRTREKEKVKNEIILPCVDSSLNNTKFRINNETNKPKAHNSKIKNGPNTHYIYMCKY